MPSVANCILRLSFQRDKAYILSILAFFLVVASSQIFPLPRLAMGKPEKAMQS
jgi:hypothetical protein